MEQTFEIGERVANEIDEGVYGTVIEIQKRDDSLRYKYWYIVEWENTTIFGNKRKYTERCISWGLNKILK